MPAPTHKTDTSTDPFPGFDNRSGVDYALRTIQQSQVQFSLMADTKANIMITVCSIVISASLTQLHRPLFLKPLITLDLFTAIALIAALMCVLPSRRFPQLRNGSIDVKSPTFNPLFFLHFQHLQLDEFEKQIAERFADSGKLYQSLVRDIYGQGLVLATKKYRFLRVSYIAFIMGFFASLTVAVSQTAMGFDWTILGAR